MGKEDPTGLVDLLRLDQSSEMIMKCLPLHDPYLLVVIFLPLTVFVDVDTERKFPMLPPPPLP